MRDASSLAYSYRDTCITSFEICDHVVIAAFRAPHLLASHRNSVAFLFYPVAHHSYYSFF